MADNSLVPISDEQAKLGQEALKALRGLGAFFERALGSVPEDLIGYLGGDWLRARRAENIANLLRRARERLEAWRVEETEPVSLSIAIPILQGAADESQDQIQDLWARLLANAMDPHLKTVRHIFIEAVKQMDRMDAITLHHLNKGGFTIVHLGNNGPQNSPQVTNMNRLSKQIEILSQDAVEVSIKHLHQLGFFNTVDPHHAWFVNAQFREFLRACYPNPE